MGTLCKKKMHCQIQLLLRKSHLICFEKSKSEENKIDFLSRPDGIARVTRLIFVENTVREFFSHTKFCLALSFSRCIVYVFSTRGFDIHFPFEFIILLPYQNLCADHSHSLTYTETTSPLSAWGGVTSATSRSSCPLKVRTRHACVERASYSACWSTSSVLCGCSSPPCPC